MMPNFNNFIAQIIATVAMSNVAEAVNMGREETFKDIDNEIGYYSWSAILDRKTCSRCEWLDGRNFTKETIAFSGIKAPIHLHCRCILFAVLKEETHTKPVVFTELSTDMIRKLTANKL